MLAALVTLLTPFVGAADPTKPGVITLSGDDFGWARPYASLANHRRVLASARHSLMACQDLAFAELTKTAAEVDADITIAPNGEVSSVTVSARGVVSEGALGCVRRRLATLAFDAAGGSGLVLRVAIIMGEPPAEERPLAFRIDSELVAHPRLTLGPIVARLSAPAPSPFAAPMRLLRSAAEACAKSSMLAAPASVTAQMFATPDGEIAKMDVTAGENGDAYAKCLREVKWHSATPRASRVEVKIRATPSGEVTLGP
jgi:hypothetical protein